MIPTDRSVRYDDDIDTRTLDECQTVWTGPHKRLNSRDIWTSLVVNPIILKYNDLSVTTSRHDDSCRKQRDGGPDDWWRWHRQQPVRPVGWFASRRGRRAGRPAAGHGQDQAADVPRPVHRSRPVSGSHVPEVRLPGPVCRFVAGHGGQRGRELGAVRQLRPVPARGGSDHRGPGRQADGRVQQRCGWLRGVSVLVRSPMPGRAGQDQAAGWSRAGRIPGPAVPRFRIPRHQGKYGEYYNIIVSLIIISLLAR